MMTRPTCINIVMGFHLSIQKITLGLALLICGEEIMYHCFGTPIDIDV